MPATKTPPPEVMRAADVAAALGVSESWVYARLKAAREAGREGLTIRGRFVEAWREGRPLHFSRAEVLGAIHGHPTN